MIAEEYVRGAPDKLSRSRLIAELVRGKPDHPESLIALARAALDAGLTGEARRHLERARAEGVNERRLWTLMADVAAMEGDAEAAQDALRHVADADPDPVWRCTSCGTQHEAWHPVCDACKSIGTIAWMHPAEAAPPRVRVQQAGEIEGLTA
jgi:HemY protein